MEEHEHDDELAATEEALSAERNERDEAVSSDDGAGYETDREKIHGNSLAWWYDTSLTEALTAMFGVIAEVQPQIEMGQALINEGVDPDIVGSELHLDFRRGPVVLGAMQLFGLWVPAAREVCAEIIAAIEVPELTEEQEAMIQAALDAIRERREAEQAEMLMELREQLIEAEAEQNADAELGLDPN